MRVSEERYRALVQNSYDVVSVADAAFTIMYVSPAVTATFGYEASEVVGQNGLDYINPEDLSGLMDLGGRVFGDPGGATSSEFRLLHRNGTYRWVECTVVNLLEHPGVQGLVVNFRDITERRQAEAELRDSEERLAALLRNADGATTIVNANGEVFWASPNAGQIWGLTDEEYLGGDQGRLVHPDDLRDVARQFLKIVDSPGMTSRVEARIRHADGTWRWFEAVYTNCLEDPAVNGIVTNIRDITERALTEQALRASEERLEYQATHDPLTGLPNRLLLLDRGQMALSRAERNGTRVALLFLDLDHFKVVNDSQGHTIGDRLLIAVADRLHASLRPTDTVARFGGDEFIVLCEDLTDSGDVIEVAERLLASFRDPFTIDDAEAYINASIGIATYEGGSADANALIRDADAAMYQAKERGRDRYEVFDELLRAHAVERHAMQSGLRHAIDHSEFEVHYQPIVDLREPSTAPDAPHRLAGVEALVRWRHPERGLLLPGTFIGQAEDNGLIIPIGRSVLNAACSFWSETLGSGDLGQPFLSVNVSARQLVEPTLERDVAEALERTGFRADLLHLEITESALMIDPDTSVTALGALKALGLRIAVDDFGTGYSSFAYLRRFPVDSLKIDKTFVDGIVEDERERALVSGMVQLGHTLGLAVVAEGVETTEQLDALRELGCDMAQGFVLARPMPPLSVEALGLHPTSH